MSPNRLPYVEIENGSLINENDPKDSEFSEPREISPLELDAGGPWYDLVDEIDYMWKVHDDYVYIFPMSYCSDHPNFLGASRPISTDGTDGFSVVFLTTIKDKAREKSLSEYACVKKVLFHELGHQLVNLEDYDIFPDNHTDYNCIMRQGLESALVYNSHFCAGCVVNFRQYYKTF